jgi:hypothetical protein
MNRQREAVVANCYSVKAIREQAAWAWFRGRSKDTNPYDPVSVAGRAWRLAYEELERHAANG